MPLRRLMQGFCLIVVVMAPAVLLAQWKAPEDGRFSEAQLTHYIAAAGQWSTEVQKMAADVKDNPQNAVTLASRMDEKLNAIVASNSLERAEYDWVGQQAIAAYGSSVSLDALSNGNEQIATQMKENAAKLAEARKRLAVYQAAAKQGIRVLGADERSSIIKSATDNQQTASDEIKQHTDEMKAADDEAKQHDADAVAADAAAAHPEPAMTGDDRTNFMTDKTNEAKAARQAANEARARQAQASSAIAAANVSMASNAAKIAHPEAPQTDEEKSAANAENEAGIASAQAEIDSATAATTQLAAAQNQMSQLIKDASKTVPPENVELLRKHKDDYVKVWTALSGHNSAQ